MDEDVPPYFPRIATGPLGARIFWFPAEPNAPRCVTSSDRGASLPFAATF
jgi:hypothetical protein